jgi:hypothetical protein
MHYYELDKWCVLSSYKTEILVTFLIRFLYDYDKPTREGQWKIGLIIDNLYIALY